MRRRRRWLWACLVLALADGAAADGPFRCAAKLVQAAPGVAGGAVGTRAAVVIFARFGGAAAGAAPSWAQGLFDPERPGSISHFYDEMSFGRLRLRGEVAPRRYVSRDPAGAYLAAAPGELGDFARFNREILEQADRDIDFSRYDNDGPDGLPNSGDDDGLVDGVFVVVDSTPRDFLIGAATGIATLGVHHITDDMGADGRPIEIREGTLQRGRTFVETSGTICHEFAHLLDLPDLYDVAFIRSGSTDPEEDSAGIGNWGLMAWGTLGWRGDDGPAAFSAWSRMRLGWAELEVPTQLQQELRIDPVGRGGKVYQVPMPNGEFFLLEYRTRAGSYYDRNIPAEGLLVWHVGRGSARGSIDLECADGRFFDAGFPLGTQPAPEFGGDNLDFWSRDISYNETFAGNLGDATDPFDGVRFTAFTPETNPDAVSEDRQWGARIENIRAAAGQMVADITTDPVVRVSGVRVLDEDRDGILVAGETAELIFDLTTPGPSGALRTVLTEIDSLASPVRAEAFYEIDPISQLDAEGGTRYLLATEPNQVRLRENFAGSGRTRVRVEVLEPFGEGWLQLWSEEVELRAIAARQQVAAVAVIDSLGNGDGQVQAGEIFRLGLALDLDQPALLQSLDFHLRPLTAGVERLGGGQLSFRRPNRYDQRSVDGPEFLVGGDVAVGASLDFELAVRSRFGQWRDTLRVEVAAGVDRAAPRVLGVKARAQAEGLQVWLPDELVFEGSGVAAARVEVAAVDGGARLADIPLAAADGEWAGVWSGAWPGAEYLLGAVVVDAAGNEGRGPWQRVALPVPGERHADRVRVYGGPARLGAVALAPGGRWSAVAAGAEVLLYDGVELARALPAAGVQSLAFDADGESLAAGGREVRVWSVADGVERAAISGPPGGAAALAFSQVGELAVGGADGLVAIWDLAAGRAVETLAVPGGAAIRSVAFSNSGRHLAAGTANAEVVLWTGRGRVPATLLGHAGQVESVSFSADGDWLASGGRAGQVWVWNLEREARGRMLGAAGAWVQSVSFSADGKWLAAGRRDGRIPLWDRIGFQPVRELDVGSGIEGLGFGGAGAAAQLLAGTWEGAWLLGLAAGEEQGQANGVVPFPAYPNPFNGAVRIPYRLVADGRVVLRIYDALGQQVRRVDLGRQAAGYYFDPGRAAQWDGRDQGGREVASGLYLYELRAGGKAIRRKIALVR